MPHAARPLHDSPPSQGDWPQGELGGKKAGEQHGESGKGDTGARTKINKAEKAGRNDVSRDTQRADRRGAGRAAQEGQIEHM